MIKSFDKQFKHALESSLEFDLGGSGLLKIKWNYFSNCLSRDSEIEFKVLNETKVWIPNNCNLWDWK